MKMIGTLDENLSLYDLQKSMPHHRAVYRNNDRYYGWTGLKFFGVIRPLRGGWAVSCPAQVLDWVYGDAWADVCFDELEEAIKELDSLMDIAERMGRLSRGGMP